MTKEQEHPIVALVNKGRGSLTEALAGSPITFDNFVVGLKAACAVPPAYAGQPTVMDCLEQNPQSVMQRLVEAAQLGLSPAPVKQHFHLIPRKIKGTLTCTKIVGYRGWIDLALRSGQIEELEADVVMKGDTFEIDEQTGKILHVKEDPFREFDEKKVRGAYAWARIKGRTMIAKRVMALSEIQKRRDCAQTDDIWKKWPEEQMRKTVVRSLLTGGFVPLGEGMRDMVLEQEAAQEEEIRVVEAQEDKAEKEPTYGMEVRDIDDDETEAEPEPGPKKRGGGRRDKSKDVTEAEPDPQPEETEGVNLYGFIEKAGNSAALMEAMRVADIELDAGRITKAERMSLAEAAHERGKDIARPKSSPS